jgi:hypothetical protein
MREFKTYNIGPQVCVHHTGLIKKPSRDTGHLFCTMDTEQFNEYYKTESILHF